MRGCAGQAAKAVALAAVMAGGCAEGAREGGIPMEVGVGPADPGETVAALLQAEEAALARWGRGDPGGFLDSSTQDCTLMDPYTEERLDGRDATGEHYAAVPVAVPIGALQMVDPRVQLLGDGAVLTYSLRGFGSEPGEADEDRPLAHVTEIFRRVEGGWVRLHTHRSFAAGTLQRLAAVGRFTGRGTDIQDDSVPPLNEDPVLAHERAALERWGRGDPDGFNSITALEYTYFDPSLERRLEGREALRAHVEPVRGRIRVGRWVFVEPRVQRAGTLAVLTFDLTSYTVQEDGSEAQGAFWHSTEVYHEVEGRWELVSTHWSYTPSWLKTLQDRGAFAGPQEPTG